MLKEKYISRVNDISVNVINSKVESVRYKNIEKTSFRIYDDGRIGVAGAIGSCNETELFKEAADALNLAIEYPAEPSGNLKEAHNHIKSFIPEDGYVEEMEALLSDLTRRHSDFIFSNKINLTETHAAIKNEAGLDLSYSDKSLNMALLYKEKTSTSVFDGYVGFSERKYDREAILAEFDLLLDASKKRVDLPSEGTYPIIFARDDMPIGKFLTDLKGDIFAQGGSLFSGKLGQKLFSETFSFSQNLDSDSQYPFFDAEGIVNQGYNFPLIKNGVIVSPYSDKKTAKRYGFTTSGSAVAAYDGVPQAALSRPYIAPSGKTFKELVGGQKAIIVLMASGGDFTPGGDFGTPVQLSLLFDGEKLLGRLPELSISSSLYDMYGNAFRGLSSDTFLPFSTQTLGVIDMKVSKL